MFSVNRLDIFQTATEFELSFDEDESGNNASLHPVADLSAGEANDQQEKRRSAGPSSSEGRYGRIVARLLKEASRLNLQGSSNSSKQRYAQLPTDGFQCPCAAVAAAVGMTPLTDGESSVDRMSAGGTDDSHYNFENNTSYSVTDNEIGQPIVRHRLQEHHSVSESITDGPPLSIPLSARLPPPPASIVDTEALEFALQRVEALEEQLRVARLEMLEKDQKCESLIKLQTKVDNEVEELTGALFQEAYRMVHAAEERSQNAERLLVEARLKVDVLESEVLGLKQIVKEASRHSPARRPPPSATPTSTANSRSAAILRFLNNSLSAKSTDGSAMKRSIFASTPLTTVNRSVSAAPRSLTNGTPSSEITAARSSLSNDGNEIDPIYYWEFVAWRENALGFDESCAFLRRIMRDDIEPCLVFENKDLSARVLAAVKENRLEMEPYAPSTPSGGGELTAGPHNFRECALLDVRRPCPYRLRTAPEAGWHFISLLARNRVAAVCDFYTYVRYLSQGIVKPSTSDAYWTIVNLRKNMALAKLGLHFVLKMNGGSGASPPDSAAASPQHAVGVVSSPP